MLFARRALDRGDDLPGDAQLRKRAKRRLLAELIVANGLVQADHALLDDVLAVGADQKIGARLAADDLLVADVQHVLRVGIAHADALDQLLVRERLIIGQAQPLQLVADHGSTASCRRFSNISTAAATLALSELI